LTAKEVKNHKGNKNKNKTKKIAAQPGKSGEVVQNKGDGQGGGKKGIVPAKRTDEGHQEKQSGRLKNNWIAHIFGSNHSQKYGRSQKSYGEKTQGPDRNFRPEPFVKESKKRNIILGREKGRGGRFKMIQPFLMDYKISFKAIKDGRHKEAQNEKEKG
jgi:hypothetical protein